MAISLKKGGSADITRNNGLSKLVVGLGWDVNEFDSGDDFDLDASAFLLNAYGQVDSEDDFVFYGNPEHYSRSVRSGGDNRTGEGEGDDEQLFIDLDKVPAFVQKIAFTVTIYDAEERRQSFGQINNAFIRVVDERTGREIVRYDLAEDFSIETGVIIGELYRDGNGWKFAAIGSGFNGGLEELCGYYGVEL